MTGLRATIRLQFHSGFTLDDAAARVDYFADLGVSHIYASPLLAARPGSTHGYDTIDYGRINPELGGEAALARLVARLRGRGMGLILDIVPNHMAVGGSGNRWWEDVLSWGKTSRYAHFFDIDWTPPDRWLHGRVLLPFLGSPYGEALRNGDIVLRHDGQDGTFFCQHYEHRFPICPRNYRDLFDGIDLPPSTADILAHLHAAPPASADGLLRAFGHWGRTPEGVHAIGRAIARHDPAAPGGGERLHRLLERQHYRLAWWRTAGDIINWRRFFDITGLAGLCVEYPDVFDAVHATVFSLYARGLIDGVRVDHVDGLTRPAEYCRHLRRRLSELAPLRPPGVPPHASIHVEKILGPGEALPESWGADGSTGYDFLEQVDAVMHDPRGEAPLTDLWTWAAAGAPSFDVEERAARGMILSAVLGAECGRLVHLLGGLARRDARTRDFTDAAIMRVLRRVLVHFPVYRTYAGDMSRAPAAADRRVLRRACRAARADLPPGHGPVLDWLEKRLGPAGMGLGAGPAIACFEHLSAPLAAKAVEDTAFYRYGRLLSRNDVGTHPALFAGTVEAFHAANLLRLRDFPRGMLATATHDHKRGEDSRARLAVLSEAGVDWARQVGEWTDRNAALRGRAQGGPAPDRADELILYQVLAATWPMTDAAPHAKASQSFRDRIQAWQTKALREAKRHTSWTDPDPAYEEGCRRFVDALLHADPSNTFLTSLDAVVDRIAPAGALNGLAQTLLRLTCPGVPDLYQGCEYWDFSLVDPDNRRPVDFPARVASLAGDGDITALARHWRDGRVKQRLIQAVLRLRLAQPALFADGAYDPIRVVGPGRGQLVAFTRTLDDFCLLVIAPRLPFALSPDPADLSCAAFPPTGTVLHLRDDLPGSWTSIIRPGRTCDAAALRRLAMLDGGLPLDVLIGRRRQPE
ncbi:malto-oligosyltrehalose synthase [Gluconacetobacter azotocaptans]|uniref:Malto-oligosyltrehalose synthase n=2 Tax=Gluconacetobacter azotocaptans TaxID=142834 RepID=A0A7W4JQH8_9PROT|nr:malto-oligosyltrehalose synthase [Gluconacetobacter azotocaptans]MBB2189064.1 malto-oligosyltrehalose synthase [Gluconacetobacter azotocaptans]